MKSTWLQDAVITPPLLAYRDLFDVHLDADVVSEFRAATNGNFAPGKERFKQEKSVTPGRLRRDNRDLSPISHGGMRGC